MLTPSSRLKTDGKKEFAEALEKFGGFRKEYKFHNLRKWKFDFYLVGSKIAIEIEGAVFAGGRHTRGVGYTEDTDKYNTATCIGVAVYRVTTNDLKDIDRRKEHLRNIEKLHVRRTLNKYFHLELINENVITPRAKKKIKRLK